MKKKNYQLSTLLALFFVSTNLFAFNYTITFTGSGASTSVESVIVQNLTKKTNVTVPLGNVLNLTDVTAINEVNYDNQNLRIFSDGTEGKITIAFLLNQSCNTQINVYGLDGKKVVGSSMNLSQGENSFNLSLPKGVYTIQVQGNGFLSKTKFINQVTSTNKPQITFVDNKNQTLQKVQKNISGVTTMFYNTGDQLLYKGISGNYSTIVTDKPILSKTTDFEFVECKDGDGNYYTTVKIDNQIWMAENLKATKFANGNLILNVTDASSWKNSKVPGWCDYENINANSKYGHIYNWYAVSDTRKIAPIGWRVANDADWTILENYLITNGFNYDGSTSGNKIAKSLSNSIDWYQGSNIGAIGTDLTKNNSSGFSATPGNMRWNDGTFGSCVGVGCDNKVEKCSSYWTSTEQSTYSAYDRSLDFNYERTFRDFNQKEFGFSIRCIKE